MGPWGSAPACARSAAGPAALSHPVRCSDLRVDSQKQRHPSGGVSVSSEMVFQLEGVELGADGKVGADAQTGRSPRGGLVTMGGRGPRVREELRLQIPDEGRGVLEPASGEQRQPWAAGAAAVRRDLAGPLVLDGAAGLSPMHCLPGCVLRQVPVPHQRPGHAQAGQPWPATSAPAQCPPRSAGAQMQTHPAQGSASWLGTR